MNTCKHIITIGREYGAGGHTVAKRIAAVLKIPYYDKEIIKIAAEKSGLTEEMIKGTEEHDTGRSLLSWIFPSGSISAYDRAILAQAQTIRRIAEEGPCIIVGRGADYILRDVPNTVNVFLYAHWKDKLQYAMDTYGDTPEQAARRVRNTDAARESYYHYLTKRKWGDLKNYHLSLNSSPVGKEACAEIIIQYAMKKG
ncbi:MAG: cytidylate kinase-like family protein [Clostridiales bacterium]|nr:cytidylate kinase-like family protein [Clostridiales bacterium]